MLYNIVKFLVLKKGWFKSLWLRLFKVPNADYINFLKKYGRFYSIGKNCHINKDVVVTNPEYVRIGDNVCLSSCTLIGHDAVVSVLNRSFNEKLDSVGKIDIKDNVFIGMGTIILPDTVIHKNSIVAAGSVVTKDVPEGKIVGGIPAKIIGNTEDLVSRLKEKTKSYPWYPLIKARKGAYDPSIEQELIKQRVKYFFENNIEEME